MTLVDLPEIFTVPDPLMALIGSLSWGPSYPERIQRGLYSVHLNFGNDLKSAGLLVSDQPFSGSDWESQIPYPERVAAIEARVARGEPEHEWGVADDGPQVLAKWPVLDEDDRALLVYCTPILKSQQPSEGGWRWHKWGPYIGNHTPTCEYLYDEPSIGAVVVFHIVQVSEQLKWHSPRRD